MNNKNINIIKKVLHVRENDITFINSLKVGMTNESFLFECSGKKYIMRVPGKGTEKLINRKNEASVYNAIKDSNISDNVIYINPNNGYKITEYIENSKCCNPYSEHDLTLCITFLKKFHNLNLQVSNEFNIFEQIEFYEKLLGKQGSSYKDYDEVKKNVFSLQKYINNNIDNRCLTHIDAVPDNFLIYTEEGKEQVKLIDFEYSGMQDPHVDIAMFCIYSLYNKKQIDHVIDIYFDNNCPTNTRIKIYCYIAVCGLLWSNWCEYKERMGLMFGKYSLAQYKYAKEFYKLSRKMMEETYE